MGDVTNKTDTVIYPKDIMPVLKKTYITCWLFLKKIKKKRKIEYVTTKIFFEETGLNIDL